MCPRVSAHAITHASAPTPSRAPLTTHHSRAADQLFWLQSECRDKLLRVWVPHQQGPAEPLPSLPFTPPNLLPVCPPAHDQVAALPIMSLSRIEFFLVTIPHFPRFPWRSRAFHDVPALFITSHLVYPRNRQCFHADISCLSAALGNNLQACHNPDGWFHR